MFKKRNKKSQNIAINVIIWAALGLIVLFILIAVFSGLIGKSAKDLESCWLRGGQCRECPCDEAEVKNTEECPPKGEDNKNKKCCCVGYSGAGKDDGKKAEEKK